MTESDDEQLQTTITGPANAAPDSPQRNRPRWDDLPVDDDTVISLERTELDWDELYPDSPPASDEEFDAIEVFWRRRPSVASNISSSSCEIAFSLPRARCSANLLLKSSRGTKSPVEVRSKEKRRDKL